MATRHPARICQAARGSFECRCLLLVLEPDIAPVHRVHRSSGSSGCRGVFAAPRILRAGADLAHELQGHPRREAGSRGARYQVDLFNDLACGESFGRAQHLHDRPIRLSNVAAWASSICMQIESGYPPLPPSRLRVRRRRTRRTSAGLRCTTARPHRVRKRHGRSTKRNGGRRRVVSRPRQGLMGAGPGF